LIMSRLCVLLYRIARALLLWRIPLLPRLIAYFMRLVFSCWIPAEIKAGRGLVLGYGGLGIVIHGETVLGDDVHIDQQVTIGGNATEYGAPVIGNHVYIGAGAKILGPIHIGDNCVIGANAVVLADVPSGSVAVGVPARVVRSGIIVSEFLFHLAHPENMSARPGLKAAD
jgi:serine O-acetyltransferase